MEGTDEEWEGKLQERERKKKQHSQVKEVIGNDKERTHGGWGGGNVKERKVREKCECGLCICLSVSVYPSTRLFISVCLSMFCQTVHLSIRHLWHPGEMRMWPCEYELKGRMGRIGKGKPEKA